MSGETLKLLGWFLSLTLISGYFDSRGFIHAATIWRDGRLVWAAIFWTNFFFLLGITFYWVSLRFLAQLGVGAPEIQAVIWFAVTLIGVALASGHFFRWAPAEQAVGVLVIVALGWLFYRTAA